MHPTPLHERRAHPRGYVAALASVYLQDRPVGEFIVRDLSAAGALLVNGPRLSPSVECVVVLKVPGLGPLRLHAKSVHSAAIGDDRYAVGVRFVRMAPPVADGLRELVEQELERTDQPSVLLADDDLVRLSNVAEDLAELGERLLLALTPLEVVHWLCDPETTVELALLSDNLRTQAGGLFEFVRAEFPELQAVALSDSLGREELRELIEGRHAVRALSGS